MSVAVPAGVRSASLLKNECHKAGGRMTESFCEGHVTYDEPKEISLNHFTLLLTLSP